MSEHDPKSEEHVEDLDVEQSESEDVKGGLNFSKIEFNTAKKLSPTTDFSKKLSPGGGQLGDGSV
jgi:hypothetical protein